MKVFSWLDKYCSYTGKSRKSRFLRCICCVQKTDRRNGIHCFGAYCGKPNICCKPAGCFTCMLSHGGRFWLSAFVSLIWIVLGGITFPAIEPNVFDTFSDAAYFSVVTIATIGYGDFHPVTTPGRAWAFFYAHIGIIIFGFLSTFLAQEFFSFLPVNNTKRYKNPCRRLAAKSPTSTFFVIYIGLLIIGSVIFQFVSPPGSFRYSLKTVLAEYENGTDFWDFSQAFYFSWVTVTTIGYGDLTVQGEWGRFFVDLYSILGVATLSILLSRISYLKDNFENKLRDMKRIRDNDTFDYTMPPSAPAEVKNLLQKTLQNFHDLKLNHKIIFKSVMYKLMDDNIQEEKNSEPSEVTKDHPKIPENEGVVQLEEEIEGRDTLSEKEGKRQSPK